MISDGMGFNTVKATEYYVGGKAVYEDFDVKLGVQTNSANNPAGYNPKSMWSDFGWCMKGATDSSSAASAIYTGVKINNDELNWSTDGRPLKTFFEMAAEAGWSTGAVSSVEFSHATPAAVLAHNISRDKFPEIAYEMIYKSGLDVIMGAGHPDYDKNGLPTGAKEYKYVGGQHA
jgi:alkaline phosphatase